MFKGISAKGATQNTSSSKGVATTGKNGGKGKLTADNNTLLAYNLFCKELNAKNAYIAEWGKQRQMFKYANKYKKDYNKNAVKVVSNYDYNKQRIVCVALFTQGGQFGWGELVVSVYYNDNTKQFVWELNSYEGTAKGYNNINMAQANTQWLTNNNNIIHDVVGNVTQVEREADVYAGGELVSIATYMTYKINDFANIYKQLNLDAYLKFTK